MPKVMLVEDDNNLREIYQARLQAEGYKIVSAKDGEEALVIAKAEKPDLVIADVMMPKISGFEMLDILRNTDGLKTVKVIMLTALGQSEDQERAKSLGADRYLVKSQVTLEDIVKAAQELLGDQSAPAASPPAKDAAPAAPPPAEPPKATSIPVAEPPADDAAKDAQSTAQAEANAESRIEDFVAGATEEATSPAGSPPADAKAAGDDKLVADAAQALIDSAKDKDAPASAKEDQSQPKDDDNSNVPIAHKKVIKPLNEGPQKDIKTLLAEEETADPGLDGDDKPSGDPKGGASGNPANPGNIAL